MRLTEKKKILQLIDDAIEKLEKFDPCYSEKSPLHLREALNNLWLARARIEEDILPESGKE